MDIMPSLRSCLGVWHLRAPRMRPAVAVVKRRQAYYRSTRGVRRYSGLQPAQPTLVLSAGGSEACSIPPHTPAAAVENATPVRAPGLIIVPPALWVGTN